MTNLSIFIWLLVCYILIPPLKHWITVHIQGVVFLLTGNIRVAQWIFWLILLPGTILHEMSHWLIAKLLLVKIHNFSLWPKVRSDGWMEMGSIQMDGKIDPFRHSLIGLAPLIFGTLAILFIGQVMLAIEHVAVVFYSGNLNQMVQTILDMGVVPATWLWLYLIFAISNAMFPSVSDRQAWRTALLYLSLIFLSLLIVGFIPTIPPSLQTLGLNIITALLFAFVVTIIVNTIFVLLISSFEFIISWLMGRNYVEFTDTLM